MSDHIFGAMLAVKATDHELRSARPDSPVRSPRTGRTTRVPVSTRVRDRLATALTGAADRIRPAEARGAARTEPC
jgi:hypothetical protein